MATIKQPKVGVLSKEESEAILAKYMSPEYLKTRYESMSRVYEIFEKESKMWAYCFRNNCDVNDLIKAHKKLNNPKK